MIIIYAKGLDGTDSLANIFVRKGFKNNIF